ncbi:MAG: tetratricopeptide repeat protein [Deltaproteobacteria bacterium]|nr:MAG: tetratricopeptide repeat protein [Deltaproteobacteria bacterium]
MSPKTLALALAISLGMSTACRRAPEHDTAKAPASPPNVLLITVDTLRADRVGCYGYEGAHTPHTDRFAAEGVRVERAIAPTPLTLPSHTSILTGLEPPAHSVRGNGVFRVPDSLQTLAEILKAEGYQTQAFVSSDVLHHRFNLDQGFDGYEDDLSGQAKDALTQMQERSAEQTMDRVLRWLDTRTEPASASPFFLWVHLFDPHAPYEPPAADAKLAATPYDGEIASADRQIGRLVKALEPNGVLDETILVFTSDHGENLGEHQEATHAMFIYEATQRVPLIFRYPRKLPAGRVFDGPARSVDIMPTILSLAGKKSGETQGADLSEALASGAPSALPVQYSESFYPKLILGMAHLEGVRQDAWTYIRAPRPELYDRRTDPGELRNLLEGDGSPTANARALELDAALTRVIEESKRFASVAEASPLDPQTVAMLQALGYMSDSGAPEDFGGIDPKDGIQIVNEVRRGTGLPAGDCATVARAVVKRLPGYIHAWNILGECVQQTGDLEGARKAFLKSLALQPTQPKVYLRLGDIDVSQGRNESARGHYAQALELLPDLVDANLAMARLDLREGRRDEAVGWYKRAVDADPKRAEASLQLAELHFQKGDFAEARNWYEKTLSIERGNYTYVASLKAGICALQLGDPHGAEPHLRRASKTNPAQWQPLYRLACAEAQQGDVEAALRALETAAAKGFNDVSKLQRDACLRPLAAKPGFQNLVRTLGGGALR